MNELIKNIGLGIFVNGAYAWQFPESHTKGILAIIEGIVIMAITIYLERTKKMTNQDLMLVFGAVIIFFLSIKVIKQHKQQTK